MTPAKHLAEVSLIIPTYNEEKALGATLESIAKQTHKPCEIIIADGGSQDATLTVAKEWVDRLPTLYIVQCPEKGRAQQMNYAAAKASGTWLFFSHADTLLPDNAIAQIQAQPEAVYAGCFKQWFSNDTWGLRFISHLHNLRCKITRIMYGDQSLFIRRSTFRQLHGYKLGHMEDIRLSEDLQAIAKPVLLNDYVVTDSRKFIQRGVMRSLLDVVIIICCYQLNRPIPTLSQSFFADIR